MFELHHLRAARAGNVPLDYVAAALRAEMLMRPGAAVSMLAAAQADPGFGYPRAALAVLAFLGDTTVPAPPPDGPGGDGPGGDGPGGDGPGGTAEPPASGRDDRQRTAAAWLRAAEATVASGRVVSAAEAETIALIGRCLRLPPDARLAEVARHLVGHPTDVLAVILGVASVDRSRQGARPAVDLLEAILPAHRDHWFVPGLLATWLTEVGRIRPAWRLAEAALELEPAAWHAAHARAHVLHATDEHRAGADWLGRWLAAHRPEGYARAHLAWHAALGRLGRGDPAGATATMVHVLTAESPAPDLDLVEFATAGWLCRAAGDRVLAGRLRQALAGRPEVAAPGSPLNTIAAGMLLAGAGRVGDLTRLADRAARRPEPVYRAVVVPLLNAWTAIAAADTAADAASERTGAAGDRVGAAVRAAEALGPAELAMLGGSEIERAMLDRCLLSALREPHGQV